MMGIERMTSMVMGDVSVCSVKLVQIWVNGEMSGGE